MHFGNQESFCSLCNFKGIGTGAFFSLITVLLQYHNSIFSVWQEILISFSTARVYPLSQCFLALSSFSAQSHLIFFFLSFSALICFCPSKHRTIRELSVCQTWVWLDAISYCSCNFCNRIHPCLGQIALALPLPVTVLRVSGKSTYVTVVPTSKHLTLKHVSGFMRWTFGSKRPRFVLHFCLFWATLNPAFCFHSFPTKPWACCPLWAVSLQVLLKFCSFLLFSA